MPIEKVAVVHKFGIISHTQRLELQERLLKQSYLQTQGTRRALSSGRNALEVSEEFVQQFNSAETLDIQESLEETAFKMLERIKRRAGIKDGGQGVHVDLPVAWTELSQLAQCKGKIQEDCLDLLVSSLEQAPLHPSQVPALFFLAETALYWLRTDAIHQPYLRTGEIKLLRMGQLVFCRIFFHHMSGQLQQHDQFKNRLYTYLDGFSECQEAYNPYPSALLCVRYINEVGHIIIGDSNVEAGEVKEGDPLPANSTSQPPDSQVFREVSANYSDTRSSHSTTLSSTVHDLSPTLWHALDVWRCINQLSGGLTSALQALAHCGIGLNKESWVDGVCAMQVLADAACTDLTALRVLQNLARGVPPRLTPSTPSHKHFTHADENKHHSIENSIESADHQSRQYLSDIYEKSEEAAEPCSQDHNHTMGYPQADIKESEKCHHAASHKLSRNTTLITHTTEQTTTNQTYDTARKAEMGSHIEGGRASEASTVATYTNNPSTEKMGLQSWHWEVAITYTELMTDIALHGSTSNIQKMALIGNNKDVGCLHRLASQPACPMKSAGLLDLVYFNASAQHITDEAGTNDWSWRVRYSAMQGLVKLCRCSAANPSQDGLRTVAWNNLIQAHSLERDSRVLEALKVGQVDASIESILSQHLKVAPSSLGSKIANGLAKLYLPVLPPPVEPIHQKKKTRPKKAVQPMPKTASTKPLRTTLREEIQLATALYEPHPGFKSRTDFDLKRVVEDQWRKEMQQTLAEEEEEFRKELQKKQKEEEEEQKATEDKRKLKLGSKYRGPSYQYKSASWNNDVSSQNVVRRKSDMISAAGKC